jgi:hypothetical protein
MAGNPELPFKLIPRRAFGERLGICPRTVFRREHGEHAPGGDKSAKLFPGTGCARL